MIPLNTPPCDRPDVDALLRSGEGESSGAKDDQKQQPGQAPLDLIDEASMESFPCSDPPCFTRSHA